MTINECFVECVKNYIYENGMNQKDFAKEAGISYSTLRRYIAGSVTKYNMEIVYKILKVIYEEENK